MPLTDFPWYKTDVMAAMALTDPWTDEQIGAHYRLELYAWTRGGLPTDEEKIRAIRRWTKAQWSRIWPVIRVEWVERDGLLVHLPLEGQRVKAGAKRTAAQDAAAMRWHSERNASAERTQCHREREKEKELEERQEPELALAPLRAGAFDLSPGQLAAAAPGLIGAWNNLSSLTAVTANGYNTRIHKALREQPDIDWWAALFERVAASDFLRGRVPGRDGRAFVADFWWVLEHAQEISAGRYDNRERGSLNAANLAEAMKL